MKALVSGLLALGLFACAAGEANAAVMCRAGYHMRGGVCVRTPAYHGAVVAPARRCVVRAGVRVCT
jgi:hypothetical protein